MLSGNFHSIPLTSIVVASDRQRQDLSGIEELASSIRDIGLINPIVITPDHVIVAGERRFRAHEHLGLTHILCQFTTELSPRELELIELEENVKRKALSWREEVAAVSRIHTLYSETDEGWSNTDTANLLSMSETSIRNYCLVQQYLDAGDTLVLNADTLSVATNIARRREERAKASALEDVDRSIDELFSKPVSVNKLPAAKAASREAEPELPLPPVEEPDLPFRNMDFQTFANLPLEGPKFNFLHCDFPYGINFDKHNGGATGTFGAYADTRDAFEVCMDALHCIMRTHVSDSAHLMFWFSARLDLLSPVYDRLGEMGWKLNPVPLVWHRSDNSGILPDPNRGPRQVYETCLFGSRGDRKIIQAVSNLYACPKSKEIHASEKPLPMLQHFFRMFVDDTTVMLDPTMGSGNAVIAAQEAGAKSALGLEALPEFYDNAVTYWRRKKARV